MGIIDTAKMIRKAQQAKSQMGKIEVIGRSKSGNLSILMNGLTEIVEVNVEEAIMVGLTTKQLQKEIKEAYSDARKQLELAMRNNMSMDSLKDLLG